MRSFLRWLFPLLAIAALVQAQHCPAGDSTCNTSKIDAVDGAGCPPLAQPEDIHFMVINLDRSTGRLARMRQAFREAGLPDFERIPGVEVKEQLLGTGEYPVPRLTPYLKVGSASAHAHTRHGIVPGSREHAP